jgi:hypothetical protein
MFAERTYPVKDPRRFVSEAGWRPGHEPELGPLDLLGPNWVRWIYWARRVQM